MHLIVRENALKPPLFSSNEVTWTEIRDEQGWLVLMILFPPGKASCLIIKKDDSDFVESAKNFGIPLQLLPTP